MEIKLILKYLLLLSFVWIYSLNAFVYSDNLALKKVIIDENNPNFKKAFREYNRRTVSARKKLNKLYFENIKRIVGFEKKANAQDVVDFYFKNTKKFSEILSKYRNFNFLKDASIKKTYSFNIKTTRLRFLVGALRNVGSPVRMSMTGRNMLIHNFIIKNKTLPELLLKLSKDYMIPIKYYNNIGVYIME